MPYHILVASLTFDNNMCSCIVFCDVSKAFDRVWHKGLMFKLRQNGIEGKLKEWLNSYLCQRKQKVGIKFCFCGAKSILLVCHRGLFLSLFYSECILMI